MKELPYYLIVLTFFLALSNELWSLGMFIDGVYYATISRNLSFGLGSIWNLYFTELSGVFYGHPPLAIWLQSMLFTIIGDSVYVERLYSLTTFLITGIFIHLIWKEIAYKKYLNFSWVVLLCWAILPLNGWACSNNFLENTMNMFVSSSIFFIIKNIKTNNIKYIYFSSIMISFAFLSKGFTGIFPLSAYLCYFILFPKFGFKNMISKSFQITIYFIIPLLILSVIQPSFSDYLIKYFDIQITDNIIKTNTVIDRFYIVTQLIEQMRDFLILSTLSIVVYLFVHFLKSTNLLKQLKDSLWLVYIVIIFMFLPSSIFQDYFFPITKFPVINAIIHFNFLIGVLYLIIFNLQKSNFISIIEARKNMLFFFIIISLFILKIWRYHIIFLSKSYINVTSIIIIVTIFLLFYYLKIRKNLLNQLKRNIGLFITTIVVLLFDWTNLFYQLLKIINHFPLIFFLATLVFICYQIFRKKEIINTNQENRFLIFFLFIGLSGTLPIMLSQKQSWFYIITTLPFFSLAIALLITPILYFIFSKIHQLFPILIFTILFYFLGPFTMTSKTFLIPYTRYITFNSIKYQLNNVERDKPLLADIKLITELVPKNTIIGFDYKKNWSTHAYFARYKNISLDFSRKKKHPFLISFEKGWKYDARTGKYIKSTTISSEIKEEYMKNYKRVKIATKKLHLYELKDK